MCSTELFGSNMKLKMTMQCSVILIVLTFIQSFHAITNSDGTTSPRLDSAVLDPEELLHGVIPCRCIDIRLCPSLLNALKHPISASSAEIQHLQRFTCGFKGFTPFVCCNEMANTPMNIPSQTNPNTRYNPTTEYAKFLTSTLSPYTEQYEDSDATADTFSTPPYRNVHTIPASTPSYPPYKPTSGTFSTNSDFNPYDILSKTTPSPHNYHDPTDVSDVYDVNDEGSSITTSDPYFYTDSTGEVSSTIADRTTYNGPIKTTPDTYSFHNPFESSSLIYENTDSVYNILSKTTHNPLNTYDPTDDISETFGTNTVTNDYDSRVKPTINSYSPTDDMEETFGTTTEINIDDIPVNPTLIPHSRPKYEPTNENPETVSEDTETNPYDMSHNITPNPNDLYDPTDDISEVFGTNTDINTHDIPSTVTPSSKDSYDPTDDISEVFGTNTDINTHDIPPTVTPSPKDSYDPTDDISEVFGTNPDMNIHDIPSTVTPNPNDSYDPTDDISEVFGTNTDINTHDIPSKVTPNPNNSYDPTDDISEVFGTNTDINTHSKVTPNPNDSYDPTDDISEVFGTNTDRDANENPTKTPEHPEMNSYDPSDHNSEGTFGTQQHRTSTNIPARKAPGRNNIPYYPTRKPVYPEELPKNSTEFQFHIQSSNPPGNVSVNFNHVPFHGGRIPESNRVTAIPPITVTYNIHVKKTNMEKKYLDFKDLYYKNLNKSKDYLGKPNYLNFFYGDKLFPRPPLADDYFDKDYRYGKQIPDEIFFPFPIFRSIRSTSTKRYNRQYNPSNSYHFKTQQYQPNYFTSHVESTQTYNPYHNNFQSRNTQKVVPSIYPNLNNFYSSSENDYSDEIESEPEPQPAPKSSQYGYHHMHNRGVGHGWERNRNTQPKKPIPATNDGIIFPTDDDDDDPKPYSHYSPNRDSSLFSGPFFSSNNRHHHHQNSHPRFPNRPNRPNNFPSWGFNNGQNFPGSNGKDPQPESSSEEEVSETTLPSLDSKVNLPLTSAVVPPAVSPITSPPATTTVTSTTSTTPVTSPVPLPSASASQVVPQLVPLSGRLAKRELLPRDSSCGVSVDERIVGGKAATLGAYPWIARIGYIRPGSTRVLYRCAATLINNIYVITAAHCVSNLPGGLTIASIRLGELDEATDPDCNQDECADPVQNFTPAQVSVHPVYDNPQYKNDVGLIRLDRPANITMYVSPICLPFDSLSNKSFSGLKATVAGWGASNVGASSANPILQWVSLTVAPLAQCAATFATRTGVQVGVGQLCAGGEQGRDSCEGDSGGPLMRPEQPDNDNLPPRYFLIGIVSFGAKRCGSDNMPGVYTNVASYLDWVLDNIQA